MVKKDKKILIIGYSQTGQLSQVLDAIELPLKNRVSIKVDRRIIVPAKAYRFPWSFLQFFDVFPECIYLDPPKNRALVLDSYYDLVVLGYQPWFLSPSLPTTAFLKSDEACRVLKNTPVISVIACRNMWTQAQLKLIKMLDKVGARLIDNVVLTDQGSSLSTFITTPRWLLTGKKSAFWGFSQAGVSAQDIKQACRFGKAIVKALESNDKLINKPILQGLMAVKADAGLIQSEKIGQRSFYIWGRILRLFGPHGSWKRKPILLFYIVFLIIMIISVVPLSLFIRWLLKPFLKNKINALEMRFELPSGSGNDRMREFPCH